MFFSSIKKINRLISKEMPNVYLQITNEKKWHSQNFDFLCLKTCPQVKFWGTLAHGDITNLLQLKNERSGEKSTGSFSIILILYRIMTF